MKTKDRTLTLSSNTTGSIERENAIEGGQDWKRLPSSLESQSQLMDPYEAFQSGYIQASVCNTSPLAPHHLASHSLHTASESISSHPLHSSRSIGVISMSHGVDGGVYSHEVHDDDGISTHTPFTKLSSSTPGSSRVQNVPEVGQKNLVELVASLMSKITALETAVEDAEMVQNGLKGIIREQAAQLRASQEARSKLEVALARDVSRTLLEAPT